MEAVEASGTRLGTPTHRDEFMQKCELVLTIPNPHRLDISTGLLAIVLRQAGISRKEWERM